MSIGEKAFVAAIMAMLAFLGFSLYSIGIDRVANKKYVAKIEEAQQLVNECIELGGSPYVETEWAGDTPVSYAVICWRR